MLSSMTDLHRWIETLQPEMESLLCRWAAINSGTFNSTGVAHVAAEAAAHLRRLGADCNLVQSGSTLYQGALCELGPTVVASKRPQASVQVLLCIHTDTVYGPAHPFQSVHACDRDRLCGPGVADAKGGLVVLLTALEAFERSNLCEHIGWRVLLTPDEEIGSPSSLPLLKQAAAECDFGLLFEPADADGSMVCDRAASAVYTIEVTGIASHIGKQPQNGRSAILSLAHSVLRIDRLQSDPHMSEVVINTGVFGGGTAVNAVADFARAQVGMRYQRPDDETVFRSLVAAILRDADAKYGTSSCLSGGIDAPPKPLNAAVRALVDVADAALGKLGLSSQWRTSLGASDGSLLAGFGLASLDTLGVRGGELHSDREYMIKASLGERAKLTALILEAAANGALAQLTRERR